MTGPEHYRQAERLLAEASVEGAEGIYFVRPENLAAAQAHATLALAASHALTQPICADTEDGSGHATKADYDAWNAVAGTPKENVS